MQREVLRSKFNQVISAFSKLFEESHFSQAMNVTFKNILKPELFLMLLISHILVVAVFVVYASRVL